MGVWYTVFAEHSKVDTHTHAHAHSRQTQGPTGEATLNPRRFYINTGDHSAEANAHCLNSFVH